MKKSTVGHNGRMVSKDRIVDGLCEIKDVIGYSVQISQQDKAHFNEVIEAAKDYLEED
tara:strand:- start:661 stop:834 length:174 start_codon:yes stop_codon:yes gene_type:complete